MNQLTFILLFLIPILLLTSCAGISVMEFQDAGTLGKGNSSLGFSGSTGINTVELYKDSTRTLHHNGTMFIPIQITFQTGLRENIDLSASIWNTSLLSHFFRFGKNFDAFTDFGYTMNIKYRITQPESERHLAFGITLLGHTGRYDHDDGDWRSSTYGIVPEIIYSRHFQVEESLEPTDKKKSLSKILYSLYAGWKVYFLSADLSYTFPNIVAETHIQQHPIIYDPFIGASFGKERRYYFEIHGMFMKNAFSGDIDIMPYFGAGTKFYF